VQVAGFARAVLASGKSHPWWVNEAEKPPAQVSGTGGIQARLYTCRPPALSCPNTAESEAFPPMTVRVGVTQ
jgi:hypothetical protein